MLKNRRVTIRDLEEKLGGVCSSETIRHILVNNLQYHKVSARWVPKQLTEDHTKRRVNTWLREADGEWYSAGIDKFIVRMRKVLEKMAIISRLNPCKRRFVCCSGMSCVHRSSATDKWAVDRPADRPAEKGAEAMVTAMWS
uniref:Transposase Tc1-like domain-containing protein n=1 Tax=Anopheles melas TaxID=34690 RepID=A0A182U4K4_9DIPT